MKTRQMKNKVWYITRYQDTHIYNNNGVGYGYRFQTHGYMPGTDSEGGFIPFTYIVFFV